VGCDAIWLKCLLNHRPPGGDVTAGYLLPDPETLRPWVERVAEFLTARMVAVERTCPSGTR